MTVLYRDIKKELCSLSGALEHPDASTVEFRDLPNAIMVVAGFVTRTPDMNVCILSVVTGLVGSMMTLWFVGGVTCITQRRNIHASTKMKVVGVLLFPLFVFTYAISMVYAVFTNIEWKPIKHTVALSAEEIRNLRKK